ncbi:hypothetical protein SERLADRAFT_405925 [Serpula lacrymans var. lacrymans S7.9]|uniref:Uncharacterized protein n=1 Tax=Serpula lacrymans var. lacrymans (strain S7.9) TaxID=578457 RepID=F8NK85_SERL9|nr:uncharacterized protein SERLADRAFT_405925 [Serpula lacrymans var. lacrymans S7.9]EGO28351.1 hypothetical protein SERLADRAFT_405925 [Serpula lacrymans var. lacrymans S7.9]
MDETLHQRWRREFFRAGGGGDGGGDRGEDIEMGENPDPKFFPFASEMDWRVACWAIEDDASRDSRIYHEMWTRKWWHAIQAHLLSRVALVPVIIATDKTQLTQFFNSKSAYPVISCWETYPEP